MRLGKGIVKGLINRVGELFGAYGKGKVDGEYFSSRVESEVTIVAKVSLITRLDARL